MNNLPTLTQEQRQELLEKARATKAAQKEYAENNLKLDWADESFFRELSQKYSVRLPQRHIPGSETKYVKRVLKKLNLDNDWWIDQTGCTVKEFAEMNPRMPCFVVVGILLELYNYTKENNCV